MKKIIYESENFTIRKDENGNLEVTYFEDYHWKACIHIDSNEDIYEE